MFVLTDLSIALASTQTKLMVIIQLCQRNSNRLEESGREVSPRCKIFALIHPLYKADTPRAVALASCTGVIKIIKNIWWFYMRRHLK